MNRVKLVTALATVVIAASGTVPASAETFYAEGVWNSDKNQFEFFDDRLNSSDPSAPYFAVLNGSHFFTTIDSGNQFFSATDWEVYHHYDLTAGASTYYVYEEYRESSLYYSNYWTWHQSWGFAEGDGSIPSIVMAAILAPEFSIFNFEQSFVHIDDPFHGGSNVSFSELISGMGGYGYFATNGYIDTSFSGVSSGLYYMTSVTLAYNLPVPEPETWAMLLAGLGIVGMTAKRRRKVNVN